MRSLVWRRLIEDTMRISRLTRSLICSKATKIWYIVGSFEAFPTIPTRRKGMGVRTYTLCMCQVRAPTEQAGVKNDDYSLTSSTQLVTSATGETGNRFAPALIWCANQLNYLVLSATSYCGHPCGWIVSAGSFGTTTRLTPSTLSLPHPHDLVVFFLPSVILVLS